MKCCCIEYGNACKPMVASCAEKLNVLCSFFVCTKEIKPNKWHLNHQKFDHVWLRVTKGVKVVKINNKILQQKYSFCFKGGREGTTSNIYIPFALILLL